MAQPQNFGLPVNGSFGVTVGGTGTAAKYFPDIPGSGINTQTSTPFWAAVPGQNRYNNQPLNIEIVGSTAIDPTIACPTVTLDLVGNTSASTSGVTVLATTGAVTVWNNSDQMPFELSAKIIVDGLSGQLYGTYSCLVGGALTKGLTVLPNMTGLKPGGAGPFLFMAARITYSVSGAANLATLNCFSVSA